MNSPPRVDINRIFLLNCKENGAVVSYFKDGVWCPVLRRSPNDWEMEDFLRLLRKLNEFSPDPLTIDKQVWIKTKRHFLGQILPCCFGRLSNYSFSS